MLCKKLDMMCKIRQHMHCNVFFRCFVASVSAEGLKSLCGIAGNRRACTRGSLLTRMWHVNSASDETISRGPRANRSSTQGASGAMYRQMSAYGWSVGSSKAKRIPIIAECAVETLTPDVIFIPNEIEILGARRRGALRRSCSVPSG